MWDMYLFIFYFARHTVHFLSSAHSAPFLLASLVNVSLSHRFEPQTTRPTYFSQFSVEMHPNGGCEIKGNTFTVLSHSIFSVDNDQRACLHVVVADLRRFSHARSFLKFCKRQICFFTSKLCVYSPLLVKKISINLSNRLNVAQLTPLSSIFTVKQSF